MNNDVSNRNLMQKHIANFLESDLTCREFARRNNLSYHKLKYWQRKFSRQDKVNSNNNQFAALNLLPISDKHYLNIEVIYKDGCVVRINGVDNIERIKSILPYYK